LVYSQIEAQRFKALPSKLFSLGSILAFVPMKSVY
jgi:hypothetical protein